MALGDNCRSGCKTKDHSSWGECARSARLKVGWAAHAAGLDKTADKQFDAELAAYKAARDEGIQPASTKIESVMEARRVSDLTGKPYNAETSPPTGFIPNKRVAKAAEEIGYL